MRQGWREWRWWTRSGEKSSCTGLDHRQSSVLETNMFFLLRFCNISQLIFPTDDACDKAWNGDPKSFPDIDSISGLWPIVAVVVATGINSREERDDGKVDEEDHRESNQQHGEAFYCTARNTKTLLECKILAEVISPIKWYSSRNDWDCTRFLKYRVIFLTGPPLNLLSVGL